MFSSAYFSVGFFSSAYWSGVGGAVAVASTGGGNAIDIGLPGGWREITDAEIRSSERRARAREEAKRRRRRKVAPTKPVEIAPVAASPVVTPTPSEVDRLIDAVANPDPFADLGKGTRDKALADALARARAAAELVATERRVTVGKVLRRSVVHGSRSMRASAGMREVTRKAAPRVMVREEERRCEASTDRRSVVSTLTRLL